MNKEQIKIEQLSKKLWNVWKISLTPREGWLYTIRTALWMTTAMAAKRAWISTTAWIKAEKREILWNITIGTMRKLLNSLSCYFVYSPYPQDKLENIIKKQILEYVKRELKNTESTMSLENQTSSKSFSEMIIKRQAEEIFRNGNWKEIWQ